MNHRRIGVSLSLICLFICGVLMSHRNQQTYHNRSNITSYPPNSQPSFFDNITYPVLDSNLSPASNNRTQAHRFEPYSIPVRSQYNSTFYSGTGQFSAFQPPIPYITDESYIPYQTYSHGAMPLYLFGRDYSRFPPVHNSFEMNTTLVPPDTNVNSSSQYRLNVQESRSDVSRDIEIATVSPDEILSVKNEVFLPNPNSSSLYTSSDLQTTNRLINFRNEEENVHLNTQTSNSIVSNTYTSRNSSDSSEIDILSLDQEVVSETQNNNDDDDARNELKNKIKELLISKQKYVAQANNLDFLPLCINDTILKIFIAHSSNYVREFSMTIFRNSDKKYLGVLMRIQTSYEDYLNKFKIIVASGNLSSLEILIPETLFKELEKDIKYSEFLNNEIKKCGDLIFADLIQSISNFYPNNATSFTSNENNTDFSILTLQHKFADELENINQKISEPMYLFNICSYFNKSEKKLFNSKSANAIIKALSLRKINDILTSLIDTMKKILLHEILIFIELHTENIEEIIKKSHVISTVFLLEALDKYLKSIKLKVLSTKRIQKKPGKETHLLRVQFIKNLFYTGNIFGYLLRCLKNYKTKAKFYALLNIFRFFDCIFKIYTNDNFLTSLQIPLYISMIFEKEFSFDDEVTKEFISFILFVIKEKILYPVEFHNDKFKYFLETSGLNLRNIIKSNLSFIDKYGENIEKINKLRKLKAKYIEILKLFPKDDKVKMDIKTSFRILYISQLYFMIAVISKNLETPNTTKRTKESIELYTRRIEKYYGV